MKQLDLNKFNNQIVILESNLEDTKEMETLLRSGHIVLVSLKKTENKYTHFTDPNFTYILNIIPAPETRQPNKLPQDAFFLGSKNLRSRLPTMQELCFIREKILKGEAEFSGFSGGKESVLRVLEEQSKTLGGWLSTLLLYASPANISAVGGLITLALITAPISGSVLIGGALMGGIAGYGLGYAVTPKPSVPRC